MKKPNPRTNIPSLIFLTTVLCTDFWAQLATDIMHYANDKRRQIINDTLFV